MNIKTNSMTLEKLKALSEATRDPAETHRRLQALANDKSIAGTPEAHLAKQRADEFGKKLKIEPEPEKEHPGHAILKKAGWVNQTPNQYIHPVYSKERITLHGEHEFTHARRGYEGFKNQFTGNIDKSANDHHYFHEIVHQ